MHPHAVVRAWLLTRTRSQHAILQAARQQHDIAPGGIVGEETSPGVQAGQRTLCALRGERTLLLSNRLTHLIVTQTQRPVGQHIVDRRRKRGAVQLLYALAFEQLPQSHAHRIAVALRHRPGRRLRCENVDREHHKAHRKQEIE